MLWASFAVHRKTSNLSVKGSGKPVHLLHAQVSFEIFNNNYPNQAQIFYKYNATLATTNPYNSGKGSLKKVFF